jgi:putative membrane protein
MIEYDPHDWRSHLLDIRGSLVREILPRVALASLWAILVVYTHYELQRNNIGSLAIKPTAHTLIGLALSLLLVFRTNSSYDRFWEGRKLWGGIVNETRNLARTACVLLEAAPELRRAVVQHAIGFAYASMHHLRINSRQPRIPGPDPRQELPSTHHPVLGPLHHSLSPAEQEAILAASHAPLAVAGRITQLLRQARDRGVLSDYLFVSVDQNVQLLVDYLGGCERIHKTPLPFAYMVHVRRALILYVYTLPFALLGDFGWHAITDTVLLAFVFLGIEEIGVEIEDPFGQDANDIPLERICATIERNLEGFLKNCEETPAV